MHIVNCIKTIRKANNLTQSEFAEKLKISRSALINYERGERTPPLSILLNISKLFNVSMDNLVALESVCSVSKDELDSLNECGLVQSYSVCEKSSEDIILSNFKMFLDISGFPVDIITNEDIKSLYKNTLNYIEFEIFKAGYVKVTNDK